MLETELLRVLESENPWLRGESLGPFFSRHLPERWVPRRKQLDLDSEERVVLVIGPRQAGKSTLIWKTLAESAEPVLYVNCEEPTIREWLRSPAGFLADLEEVAPDVPTLFFEEIQGLDEAGLFLKGLVDRRAGHRIYATGSSSFHLEAATRESLAGRARRHLLLPLSLPEIRDTLEGPPAIVGLRLDEAIGRILLFGSYPAVHPLEDPRAEIAGLVESFVVRDASDRFRIQHVSALRKILRLAASQVGNLVNFSDWATIAGVSVDTVQDYCQILEDTHVLRFVRPFVGGKRAEITRAPKVFFLDNGIRNQIFGGFEARRDRPDAGALFENLLFTELAKRLNPLLDGLHYWRSKSNAEIDFVIERQGRIIAIEAKAGRPHGPISRSARSFVSAYRPEALWIVHRRAGRPSDDPRLVDDLDGVPVRRLHLAELDAALDDFLGEG